MEQKLVTEQILKYARGLDDAIEQRDIEGIVSCFSDDCEIELLGVKLTGKEGLKKAIGWMYGRFKDMVLVPVAVMVDGNTYFEEFVMKAKVKGNREIEVKQAEVLVYDDDYRVRSLRLYFDGLELAEAFASSIMEKTVVRQLRKASLKGLA